MAGVERGKAPIQRNICPSILASPISGCAVPVQWRVGASVKESFIDQMLKYGSCVTSGTAGGRKVCVQAAVESKMSDRALTNHCMALMVGIVNRKNTGILCPHAN